MITRTHNKASVSTLTSFLISVRSLLLKPEIPVLWFASGFFDSSLLPSLFRKKNESESEYTKPRRRCWTSSAGVLLLDLQPVEAPLDSILFIANGEDSVNFLPFDSPMLVKLSRYEHNQFRSIANYAQSNAGERPHYLPLLGIPFEFQLFLSCLEKHKHYQIEEVDQTDKKA